MEASIFTRGCALCFVLPLINLHPSAQGKAKLCRWLHSTGQGELCDWKLAESCPCFTPSQLVAVHHSRRAGQVPRHWQRRRAGIKHESRSGTEAAMQGECAPRALCWTWEQLREDAANVRLRSYSHDTRLSSPWEMRRKWATLQTAKHYSGWLWKRSVLNWKAKRFEMGGCNKHIMKCKILLANGKKTLHLWLSCDAHTVVVVKPSHLVLLINQEPLNQGNLWKYPSTRLWMLRESKATPTVSVEAVLGAHRWWWTSCDLERRGQ